MQEFKPNRSRMQCPRKQMWCWGCDMHLVSAGGRCPICGSRITPLRYKKYIPMPINKRRELNEDA